MVGTQVGDRLQVSLKNQFKALFSSIVGTLFMLIALYFLDFEPIAIKVFLFFWLVLTLPAVYLHLEYLIKNSSQKIQIKSDRLIVIQRNKSIDYRFVDRIG